MGVRLYPILQAKVHAHGLRQQKKAAMTAVAQALCPKGLGCSSKQPRLTLPPTLTVIAVATSLALGLVPYPVHADEGGVSFWAPGQFGSFSAVPSEPGWSVPLVYYHVSADAGASKNFITGGLLTAGIDATGDLLFFFPTYTFTQPVLGAQAAFALGWAVGHLRGSAEVSVTGPQGNTINEQRTDTITGGSDLYGLGTLKWADSTNYYLAYTMFGAPTGAYQVGRLANLSTNHWSIDAGGGYTYLDPKKQNEFSIVAGFTYNFENPDTNYKNGIDSHIDWAASRFLNEQTHVGVVGYFFQQLTGDSGAGARLGAFESRIAGIGPEIGYFFPVSKEKGYVNLKGYWEFAAQNRAEGWNLWLSLALPLSVGK
jgi:hypothetical protein